MTTSTSPQKLPSRSALPLPLPDPSSIRLPDSPEKNRSLRRLQSHTQLSSAAATATTATRQPRLGLSSRQSREQLNTNPSINPTITTNAVSSTRIRANSDAPTPYDRSRTSRKPLNTLINQSSSNTLPTNPSHTRKSSLELTLRDGPPAGTPPSSALSLLRHSIITSGVAATKEGMSDYRVYLWLTLLNIPPLPSDIYLSLIHRGRSPSYEKISNDVFRTLATDTLFKRRVTDASLTRVLNATAWRIHDEKRQSTETSNMQAEYNQGLNVLSAPLLYASRSEAQAYALLTSLISDHIPAYLSPTMSGVHAGLDLIDRILAIIEPNLAHFLLATHKLPAKIYAFASVSTLCACTPPLPEVLKLWDFLFAFGVHLNIICVVAQVILIKDKLKQSASPMALLRPFPQLNAQAIISLTLVIVRDLPADLYEEVVGHTMKF